MARTVRRLRTVERIEEEIMKVSHTLLLAAVERLATLPHIGRPGRVPRTRELVVPGTPYIIPYRLRGQRLEIIAVFHARQRWPKHL